MSSYTSQFSGGSSFIKTAKAMIAAKQTPVKQTSAISEREAINQRVAKTMATLGIPSPSQQSPLQKSTWWEKSGEQLITGASSILPEQLQTQAVPSIPSTDVSTYTGAPSEKPKIPWILIAGIGFFIIKVFIMKKVTQSPKVAEGV